MKYDTEFYRLINAYGKNAKISHINGYNIIHLDDPTEDQIKQRIKEILYDHTSNDLDDDCPCCQSIKGQPCDIIYYEQP